MNRALLIVPAMVGLALTACSGSTGEVAQSAAASATAAAPSSSPAQSCPPAKQQAFAWPPPVPSDVPKLPGVVLGETKRRADGVTVVRFTTSTSLEDGFAFINKGLPAAGYILGRGDVEETEADAPFHKGDLYGVFRGLRSGACATDWFLSVMRVRPDGGTGTAVPPTP